MKRGKDEDKAMGPMFPRLHVNDTDKGGPRAPPRNKMALYEQLSIPSQRFNGGVPSSSNRMTMNERDTYSSFQQSSSNHPIRKPEARQSDFNNHRVQQEHKTSQEEEDDFTVPIFDQQSGTGQNHQNRQNNHNAKQNNSKFQKENPQEFAVSASNQPPRQNIKASLMETNNRNARDSRVDSQADNTLWGDSVLNEASKASGYENNSVPLREVQKEGLRSPNDGDAVSENSMVDSICGVDISPDDVVGIIGQKHFWKARRAIVNQQRVFAVQVFELHRLIKVQKLIAGSPHLLVEENAYITKPPKVSPIKKIPIEYIMKSTIDMPKNIDDLEKPNEDMEFSAENAVGKASLSSVQNGSQTTNCRPFGGNPLPSDQNMGSWNFNPPPGPGPGPQWLIPVMSPSEGLVYKPYPAPGFMNPVYGGCGPLGSMPGPGYNMPSYGASPSHHHHHHYFEGSLGVNPFTPLPASHGYFPSYGMQMANTLVSSSTTVDPIKPFNQGSTNVQTEKTDVRSFQTLSRIMLIFLLKIPRSKPVPQAVEAIKQKTKTPFLFFLPLLLLPVLPVNHLGSLKPWACLVLLELYLIMHGQQLHLLQGFSSPYKRKESSMIRVRLCLCWKTSWCCTLCFCDCNFCLISVIVKYNRMYVYVYKCMHVYKEYDIKW